MFYPVIAIQTEVVIFNNKRAVIVGYQADENEVENYYRVVTEDGKRMTVSEKCITIMEA
jgi:hypothetical protein